MTEREEMIQHFMKKLKCSREDAEKIWQDDLDDVSVELTPEQKAVAKEMAQADRKKESTPRKRERKPDNDKRLLISVLHGFLHDFLFASQDHLHCEMTNPEREIEFTFRGNLYRLTLSKPRKEKSA